MSDATNGGEPAAPTELFERGLEIRRAVVGSEYVDRSLASADEFNASLQALITEWCWGSVWSRPGLDRRTRSVLNLGMIIALNRPAELALHVRGAARNGLTREEISEIVLQSAIYCGAPAALDASRVARKALDELEAEGG